MRTLVCLVMAGVVFTACDNPSPSATKPASDVTARTHTGVAGLWRLTEARVGNSSLRMSDGYQSTSLRLYGDETDRWGQAMSGCQVGSVRVSVDAAATLDVDDNGDMKSCPPSGHDALDGQYLNILALTIDLEVKGDYLIITGPQSRLTFARDDHAPHHAGR